MIYKDREDAGQVIAQKLIRYNKEDGIVLALPRGGVPVGAQVARALKLPLDIVVPRKLGAPGNPELAIGAIGSGGVRFLDEELIKRLRVTKEYIEEETERQLQEMDRRLKRYRGDLPPLRIRDKNVILVDDGIATGSTMIAAIMGIKSLGPKKVIVAVPVGPKETIPHLQREADLVIFAATPEPFYAVGRFYDDFRQVNDEEVINLLSEFKN